jgi:SpoIID/LytB domain protein
VSRHSRPTRQARLPAEASLEQNLLSLIGDFTASDSRRVGGDEARDRFILAGTGAGHGLGMSQYGAKGAAQRGRDYRSILAHYYQGTGVGDVGTFSTNVHGSSEEYLVGVVEAEMNSSWPMEALKAQTVAARSYAYINRRRLDNSPRTQAWVGPHLQTARARQAVEETRGQVVSSGGQTVPAYFHSTAGGCTENNENVWGGSAIPWLRGVTSPWESDSPHWNWRSKAYSREQMQGILNQDGWTSVRSLQSIRIVGRGVSGRATVVEIRGSEGVKRVPGRTFQRIFNAYSPDEEPGLRNTLFGFV